MSYGSCRCLKEGRSVVIAANKRDLVALQGISGKAYEDVRVSPTLPSPSSSDRNSSYNMSNMFTRLFDAYIGVRFLYQGRPQALRGILQGLWRDSDRIVRGHGRTRHHQVRLTHSLTHSLTHAHMTIGPPIASSSLSMSLHLRLNLSCICACGRVMCWRP
jgi:hypothetical protein